MSIIKTRDLKKVYGKGDTAVKALDGVSIGVSKGEFVAVVGASGSGKSTLLHILGGLDKQTSGDAIIDGVNVFDLKEKQLAEFRRRKIGFIFQNYNLMPVLTLEENIELPILLDKQKVDKPYIADLMNVLGLESRKTHLPSQLSGGQQQRVAIARALANKPSIIFADEPTGNLDSKNSQEVMELLKFSAKKYNQTIMVITHDANISVLADRRIILSDGKVVSDI